MSQRGGSEGIAVPGKIEDGYGNHCEFTEPQPDVLRIEDNAGGFAVIDWTGEKPVLTDSHSAVRSDAARGPSVLGRRMASLGEFLLLATPLITWWLAAGAVAKGLEDVAIRTARLPLTIGLVGMGLLLPFSLRLPSGGEQGMADTFLYGFAVLAALACSGFGLLLLAGVYLRASAD